MSEDSFAKMIERFKKCFKAAYDFDEALDRQKLSRESIELLREKLKLSEVVPKLLIDNQVVSLV